MRNSPYPRRIVVRWLTAAIVCLAACSAQAQDTNDQRRCTGEWRATVEERIASCTALIDSGRYQGVNLAILHDNRGMARRAQGDLAGALKDFSDAIGLDPNSAHALANRGGVHLAQRDFDGAIADLNQAIKLDANDASAFMARGEAYETKGDPGSAIADYSQAIRFDPGSVGPIIGRGDAYLNRGQYDLAMQDYDRAAQLDPTNEQVLRNRHEAQLEKAKQESARALSIEANVPK